MTDKKEAMNTEKNRNQESLSNNKNLDVNNATAFEVEELEHVQKSVEDHKEEQLEHNEDSNNVRFPVHEVDTSIFAGFWMRFWAYLLDLIVIASIGGIIVKPIFKALDISQYSFSIFSPITIATAIVFYLYFVLMTKYFGQTIGKMVFGLKVVSLKQDSLTWGTIVFRECVGRFISKTVWLTYLLVGILPKKQGLHDLFADTSVILEKKR